MTSVYHRVISEPDCRRLGIKGSLQSMLTDMQESKLPSIVLQCHVPIMYQGQQHKSAAVTYNGWVHELCYNDRYEA